MKGIDFNYDGVSLGSYGYMIANFKDGVSLDSIPSDSQRTFNVVQLFSGKYQPFVSAIYDSSLQISFSICKIGCDTQYDLNISTEQVRQLKRWLNQPTAKKLFFYDDDISSYYWNGSFNVTQVWLGDMRIGLNLLFTCDAPFGYQNPVILNSGIINAENKFLFNNVSDEHGYLYPTLEVSVKKNGTLTLYNGYNPTRKTIITNCKQDEHIIFTPSLVVSSSDLNHNLSDDFNFVFYRIENSFHNIQNSICTDDSECQCTIVYTPIAKVVV